MITTAHIELWCRFLKEDRMIGNADYRAGYETALKDLSDLVKCHIEERVDYLLAETFAQEVTDEQN